MKKKSSSNRRRRTLGDVTDVFATQVLVISDCWAGYCSDGPHTAEYELHRDDRGAFVGTGTFSTGYVGPRTLQVRLPAPSAKKFLAALAGAPITLGPYEPDLMGLDDYPEIRITLHASAGELGQAATVAALFTESQGKFNTPWGALVGGVAYASNGEEIGSALRAIHRPLQRSELGRMLRELPPTNAEKATTKTLLHAEPVKGLNRAKFADKIADSFCEAVNAERKRRGLPPLRDE